MAKTHPTPQKSQTEEEDVCIWPRNSVWGLQEEFVFGAGLIGHPRAYVHHKHILRIAIGQLALQVSRWHSNSRSLNMFHIW
jgi:hypothetical protein